MLKPALPPELSSSVMRIEGFEELDAVPVRRRELPMVGTPIILAFGAPYRLSRADAPDHPVQTMLQFVAGLHDTYTTTESTGPNWGIQIDLAPIGAYRILGLPMSNLTNRLVAMEDVFGRDGRMLRENLEATGQWDERFRLVIAFLRFRLQGARVENPAIGWVWQQLTRVPGTMPIRSLAEELAWSHRRLIRTFEQEIGLTPKKVMCQLRFLQAVDLVRSCPSLPLVDVATATGYFDQSHFSREFRSFAGVSPGQFRQEVSGSALHLATD